MEEKNTYRLILGEDICLLKQTLCNMLSEKNNIRVLGEAETGKEALKLYYKHKPHLVLLDLILPKMNGLDVAQRIRKKDSKTKIIIMTISEDKDALRRAMLLNVNGYFLKSDDFDNLYETILSVMAGLTVYPNKLLAQIADRLPAHMKNPEIILPILTKREIDVMMMTADNYTLDEIAESLNISVNTVSNHRKNIYKKLQVGTAYELRELALNKGLL